MTDEDKPIFNERLLRLATILDKKISRERRNAYWEVLKHMSLPDFIRAADHVEKTEKWFPLPASFIQAARTVGWI